MVLDRAALKMEAKGIVKSARVSAYLFTLLFLAISWLLSGISEYVSLDAERAYYLSVASGVDLSFLALHRTFSPVLVTFVSIMVGLLNVLLNAGYARYHLGVRRGEEMPYETLFDGFSFAGKLILLSIVQYLFIFLWSLLFVIPGIIAAYRYRFAVYNLCEDPEMGVMEALNMSKAQTNGFKWQLFALDWSFIGWILLCGLTLGILYIWVQPYIFQTDIGYFQQIKSVKGIGWTPHAPESDGRFHPHDPFDNMDNMGM